MTTTPTPTGPPAQPWGTPPPPAEPRPSKPAIWRRPWVVGVAGLVVGIMLGGAIGSTDTPSPAAKPKAPVTQATSPAATDAPAETTPAETYRTPKASDFKLTVKVLSKENFDTAGSVITYRINAGWPDGYDPDKTYEVTYEVRGPQDGAKVNTFTVTGDEYERPSEETVQTASTGTKLTAKVTAVEEI